MIVYKYERIIICITKLIQGMFLLHTKFSIVATDVSEILYKCICRMIVIVYFSDGVGLW